VLQKSKDQNQLGLDETLDTLINQTFKTLYSDTYKAELQNTINYVALKYLFNLASQTDTYPQVNAIVKFKLNDLNKYLKTRKTVGVQQMYDADMMSKINQYVEHPENFKLIPSPKIPDGSPIGCEE